MVQKCQIRESCLLLFQSKDANSIEKGSSVRVWVILRIPLVGQIVIFALSHIDDFDRTVFHSIKSARIVEFADPFVFIVCLPGMQQAWGKAIRLLDHEFGYSGKKRVGICQPSFIKTLRLTILHYGIHPFVQVDFTNIPVSLKKKRKR